MSSTPHVIIKDPLYKQILLHNHHKYYIDLPEFQRLRYIKQTTFVDMVYPSANHTRFSHSLGVYHLMKKVLSNGLMDVSEQEQEEMLLAALLHDLGHGPFSHAWEQLFPHFDHEQATKEILQRYGLDDVSNILNKHHHLADLISSSIDMDKLDYMARDSYFAGVSYGVAEVDFIIQHLYVKNHKLTIKPSALSSVEDMITQRVNLFKTVYFHKIAIAYDFLLKGIFRRVQQLRDAGHDIPINEHIRAFFDQNNTIDDLLSLTDTTVLHEIQCWSLYEDAILQDLCAMFLFRKKFKIINCTYQDVSVERLREETAKHYDPDFFFGHIKIPIKILQTPIFVEIDGEQRQLEEVSDLIRFYTQQNWYVEYVLLPRDLSVA